MTDAYELYNGIAKSSALVHLECWAHRQSYFIEAEALLPKRARGPVKPRHNSLWPLPTYMR